MESLIVLFGFPMISVNRFLHSFIYFKGCYIHRWWFLQKNISHILLWLSVFTRTEKYVFGIKEQKSSLKSSLTYSGWGRGQKAASLKDFSLLPLQTEGFATKTVWLLVLTLLLHWCKISRLYLVPVPNYWTWTNTAPQKRVFSGQIFIKSTLC